MPNAYFTFIEEVRKSPAWQSYGATLPVPAQGRLLGQMYHMSVRYGNTYRSAEPPPLLKEGQPEVPPSPHVPSRSPPPEPDDLEDRLHKKLLALGLGVSAAVVVGPMLIDAAKKHPKGTAAVLSGILVAAGLSNSKVKAFLNDWQRNVLWNATKG